MSWDAGALHILPELEEDQQHARYPLGSDGVESSKATTHTRIPVSGSELLISRVSTFLLTVCCTLRASKPLGPV